VISIGLGGFGDGAADDDAVLATALGPDFLVGAEGAGGKPLLREKIAGTEDLTHCSGCFSDLTTGGGWFGMTNAGIVDAGGTMGDWARRLAVGDEGIEFWPSWACIFI
jgi:hypothetical protein